MKILYVTTENIYATGSSNLRNVSMISGLASLGYDVSIMSFEASEDAKKFDEKIKLKLENYEKYLLKNRSLQKVFAIKKETKKNDIFEKLKVFIYRFAKKVYMKISTSDTLMQAVNNVDVRELPQKQFDLLISSSDPISSHGLAELFLKYCPQQNCRWIQYWGDPLYYDITRTNTNRSSLKKKENEILSKATKVVYTNPIVVGEQQKLFPNNADKMFFVPTPFDFVAEKKQVDVEYVVGYFGSYMSCVRDIMPLCDAADTGEIKAIIMGGGDQTIPQSRFIETWSFQNTMVVSKYEAKCQILLCICNHASDDKKVLQIPGKVFHYSMTNKPILIVGASDEIREFLERYDRFYFSENTSSSILEAIKKIKDENREFSPVEEFSLTNIASQFIQ